MKKNVFAVLAALTLVFAMVGSASAAGTAAITVNASVAAVCKNVVLGPTTINFGALDPSTGPNAPAVNRNVTYNTLNCTNGMTIRATIGGVAIPVAGSTRNMASGGNNIPYTLTYAGATGTGFSALATPPNLTLNFDIAAGAYDDAAVGSYSDSVTVTFEP